MDVNVGDTVVVESPHVGQPARRGEVVEVIPGSAGDHYRVRWTDEHETIFFPSSDTRVERS